MPPNYQTTPVNGKMEMIPKIFSDIIFKSDDGVKYISNQILYETYKTPPIYAWLYLSHPNPLVTEYQQIEINEENLLRYYQFLEILSFRQRW